MTYNQNDYILFNYGNLIYTGKIEVHFHVSLDFYNISTIYARGLVLIHDSNILCKIERDMSIIEAKEKYPEYFI